jgi:predicted RNA-binding protein with PUA-like domain
VRVRGLKKMRRYWLMKTDPDTFSWSDLAKAPQQTTRWDGVRNYEARNYLRDEVGVGDFVLFYHSRSDPPAVVGVAKVVRSGYPDPTQFDRKSRHFDPDANPANPRWFAVDIQLDHPLARPAALEGLRRTPGLEEMVLLRKGSRLSVQPVTAKEWTIVVSLGAGCTMGGRKK